MFFPKKLSTATMHLDVKSMEAIAVANKPKAVSVLRIWGIVEGRESKTSTLGPYTKYIGNFAALNLTVPENDPEREARSRALFVPAVAESIINSLFSQKAGQGETVEFNMELTVTYVQSRVASDKFTQFSWGAKPITELKYDGDVLARMAESFPAPKIVKLIENKSKK